MIELAIWIGFFCFLILGVPCAVYTWCGIGYEKAPVAWLLYLGGVLALFSQLFPDAVVALFPPHTIPFIIGANAFLFFAALAARLELVGRHPDHELFLKNRIEFVRFRTSYLLVKAVEVTVQQVIFGVMALSIGSTASDPYLATLYLAGVIGAIHLPSILFVRPSMSLGIVGFSMLIGLSVGASVLILGMGIAVSSALHWLIYLGAVPYLWRMCEKGTCPFA